MAETQYQDWTAAQVNQVCERMQTIERVRASDRALIDNQFNGGRPYTAEEQEKYQIYSNVNFLEGSRILTSATNQINNALIFKDRFFTCISKKGKAEKRQEYGEAFTRNIHDPLKRGSSGKRHMYLLKSRNASVALHGIGTILWMNQFRWCGRFIPLEDMLIPTDTLCDYSNLMYFAVNLYLTVGEFFDMTHGDKVDKGWNTKAVNRIIEDLLKNANLNTGSDNSIMFQDQPEKRVEWMKQNRCMLDDDAISTVKLRMFLYKNPKTGVWHRVVVLREGTPSQPQDLDFIYDGRDAEFADDIDHIIHTQFGDNSIVAPLKYQSVRGLGVLLYSAVEASNRLKNELFQHAMFNLKTLLRISNPVDRDRPKLLDLSQYSVLEDGVSFIPAGERYQIDARLIESVQAQMRQNMSESSASFVQNINDGTNKEMTATEAQARLQAVNVQVSAMLQSMYAQEEFYYQELIRRFLLKNSEDEEVKRFQERCKKDGIPEELMKVENWDLRVERVLGAGDQMLANQEASALLAQKQWMDPTSQRIVERKWITTITRNPDMGALLVPEEPNRNTSGVLAAEDAFPVLMLGIPIDPREGINRADYTEALLGMLKAKVEQIQVLGGVPESGEQIIGLETCINHIAQNIQLLAADPTEKQRVKEYSDFLGNQANMVKAFAQRFAEQRQAGNAQVDPAAMAKIQAMQLQAQTKAQVYKENSDLKLAQKQASFQQRMEQEMQRFQAEMAKMAMEAQNEIIAAGVKAGAKSISSSPSGSLQTGA